MEEDHKKITRKSQEYLQMLNSNHCKLRIVYNDHSSTFEDLLAKDNSVSVHHKNIRSLAIELYNAKNNLSSQLMLKLFQRREVNYNIRSQKGLRSINTSSLG